MSKKWNIVNYLTLLVITLGIFAVAIYFFSRSQVVYQGERDPHKLADSGRVYTGGGSGLTALYIYDMARYGSVADSQGEPSTLYLVNFGEGIVLLEARDDDTTIRGIYDSITEYYKSNEEILQEPLLTVAEPFPISDFSEDLRQALEEEKENNPDWDLITDQYLAAAGTLQTKETDYGALVGGGICLGLGVLFLVLFILFVVKDRSITRRLTDLAPESSGDLGYIFENAAYRDENLKLCVFRDHLVTNVGRINLQDLRRALTIRYVVRTSYIFWLIPLYSQGFLEVVQRGKKKKNTLAFQIGRKREEALLNLGYFYDFLRTKYPEIEIVNGIEIRTH